MKKMVINEKCYFFVAGGETQLARCKVNKKASPIKFLMHSSCMKHAGTGDYVDLVTYFSAKTSDPSATDNQKMVMGTPEVVYVYAYDDNGHQEKHFSDKFLYINLASAEHGCHLELTYQSNAPTGQAEAEEEGDEDSENSEITLTSEPDSVIGPDDPYYKDMRKHFNLDSSKYASSCFSSAGYQPGSSFNQPWKKDY